VDLHTEVPRRRGELAAAALTIVRAYLAAGAPRQDIPTFGRYEAWSGFVREPMVWLGMADPCETRRAIEARDPVRDKLGNLLEAWHAVFGERGQTVAAAIDATEPEYLTAALAKGDGSAEALQSLRNALEAVGDDRSKLNGRWIGKSLSGHEGRIERGYRADQAGTRSNAVLWAVSFVSFVSPPLRTRKKCQNGSVKRRGSFSESAGSNSQKLTKLTRPSQRRARRYLRVLPTGHRAWYGLHRHELRRVPALRLRRRMGERSMMTRNGRPAADLGPRQVRLSRSTYSTSTPSRLRSEPATRPEQQRR
jgi:hypothetical protein